MKIHVIVAALPPQLDGIGDYTANLVAELAHSATVTVLTGGPQPKPIPKVRIITAFSADKPSSLRQIARIVEVDKPDWVLLQYNPFSYGRWGLNLYLPETIRRLSRFTRVAIMVHEPFVPIITPQFAVMGTWQRWQLWRLGQAADVIFFSIDFWQHGFRHWFPRKPLVHLPVGSNVPHVPINSQEARARLGIPDGTTVLGLFGTASSGRMLDRAKSTLVSLREKGVPVQLLYVGPHKAEIYTALGSADIIADGPFPAEEVSRRLAAMDIYLAAYGDGVSTRRGAFIAALQHGIATVGTRGFLTDTLLKQADGQAFLLADVGDPEAFHASVSSLVGNAAVRQRLGDKAQQLFSDQFSWGTVAERLLCTLKKNDH